MGLANIAALERKVASQLTLANLGFSPYPVLHSRYRIEEIRGRGARGLVVRATDTSIGRRVALKLYPPLSDSRPSGEVAREAQALGRLEHPNVVRIYDVGQAELALELERMTVRFMCIEYVEGTNLRTWAGAKGLRRSARVRALLAAAEGLAAAHEAGMVHRDVKPENIMVERSHRIKVVDFGLAGALYSEADATGGGVGTLEYMAPEAREGQAFAEADQFSFAMVAWELLLGCRPYDSTTESYKPPQQDTFSNAASLPRYLRAPLERALSFRPSARHRDMRALVRAIRRGQSLRRLGLGAAIGGASLACAGLGLLAWQGVPELSSETPARASLVPETVAERAGPVPTTDACRELAGRWHFNTAVTWANNVQFRGINGYYELELEPKAGCEFRATVRKTGSTKHQNTPREVRSGTASVETIMVGGRAAISTSIVLASEKYEPSEYRLSFVFEDSDSMVGAYWHRPQDQDSLYIAGVLKGRRTPLGRDISEHEVEIPCAVECVPSCPDEKTMAACESRCEAGESAMPCGAPSHALSIPLSAQSSIDSEESPLDGMSRWARRRCERTGQRLEGDWTLFVLGEDNREFSVRASGCTLSFSGGVSGSGDVDGRGVWRRVTQTRVGFAQSLRLEPQLALTGWGPAFGVTREGKPAAAYRKR